MKSLFVFAALTATLLSAENFSDEVKNTAGRPRLTMEQREARKYRHFGGHILQPVETKSVAILDTREKVRGEGVSAVAAGMSSLLSIPIQVGSTEGAGCILRILPGDGVTPLLILPEKGEVWIDVKALSMDTPSPDVLQTRIEKELWRGLIYMLGGGNTYFPQCVMKQVTSLKELDALPRTPCPDTYRSVREGALKFGIRQARRTTYRQAVREGWAPTPTNDVQRAIWEEVKKGGK